MGTIVSPVGGRIWGPALFVFMFSNEGDVRMELSLDHELGVCNSYLEVNLAAVGRNVRRVREHVGSRVGLMVVLKSNAYSAGLLETARYLTGECRVEAIACAQTCEAYLLREDGISCPILVMGGVPFHNIPTVVARNIMTPAYSAEYLARLDAEAGKQGKIAEVQIKVETGLERIGVRPGPALAAICLLLKSAKNLRVVGAYTHFAESENPDRWYTLRQMAVFREGVAQIRTHGFALKYIHAFNSGAIVWLSDPIITHVRAAGIFFGYDPGLAPVNALGTEEVLAWRAFITNVHTVQANDTVGYNRFFKAERETTIATVSVGFGDGYSRYFASFQGAEFLVHGRRAKVIASCMDQTILDVSGIDCKVNDIVTLLGADGDDFISAFEWQRKMGQTYLAIAANVAPRVKRIYRNQEVCYIFRQDEKLKSS